MASEQVKTATKLNREWWLEDDLVSGVTMVVKRARQADQPRERAMAEDLGLWCGRHIKKLNAHDYGLQRQRNKDQDPRLPLSRSIVSTVHSKIAKDIPRTVPITENATWHLQRQADYLESFLAGVKDRNDWAELFPLLQRDRMILMDAVVKVYSKTYTNDKGEEWGRIHIDRIFPWELRVDPIEATYGKPRSIFYEAPVDRHVAMAEWPEHAASIATAKRAEDGASYHSHADQVLIIEAYHLPSGPDAGDGRRVVICEGCDTPLEDDEWTRDHFPFATMSWDPPVMGFWGHSLVEDVAGIHITLNEVDETIRDRMRFSIGFFLTDNPDIELEVDNSTTPAMIKVPSGMLTAEGIRYETVNMVAPELFQEREALTQKGYEFAGVSQLSAQSQKPSGLDAAVALREFQDIESERFATPQRVGERFDLRVSKLIITEAKDLDARDIDVEVPAQRRKRRRNVLDRLRWSKIDLKEDAYELTIESASSFPRHPAGRLAMVEQLIAAGFLDRQNAMRLLKIPDVEGVMNEQLAPYFLALDLVEIMVEEERSVSPIPEMDLALTYKVVNLAILRGEMDEYPEATMARLRGFASQVQQLEDRAEQEAMARAAAAQGAMVPNAAGALQPGMATGAVPQGQAAPIDPAADAA